MVFLPLQSWTFSVTPAYLYSSASSLVGWALSKMVQNDPVKKRINEKKIIYVFFITREHFIMHSVHCIYFCVGTCTLMQTSLCMLCFYLTKLIWNATELTAVSEIDGKRKGVFLFTFKGEKGRHDAGVIMEKDKRIKSFRCKSWKQLLKPY